MIYQKKFENGILNNCEGEEKELKKYENELSEILENIAVLKNEVVKTLTGESIYTSELLNDLITEKENRKEQLIILKDEIENKINQKKLEENELLQIKDKIPKWKKEFKRADLDVKKMLVSEIIKEIRIYNDRYEIDFKIELNKYIREKVKINNNNELICQDVKLLENTVSLKMK